MTSDPPLIAILDDEPDIRRLLADALEEAGFRTAGFGRATEFEAALRRMAPDACLIDLGLPDPDGLDEDDVEAGAVEHAKRLRARPRQSAEVPARGH